MYSMIEDTAKPWYYLSFLAAILYLSFIKV